MHNHVRNMPPNIAQIWNIILDAEPLAKILNDLGEADNVILEKRIKLNISIGLTLITTWMESEQLPHYQHLVQFYC